MEGRNFHYKVCCSCSSLEIHWQFIGCRQLQRLCEQQYHWDCPSNCTLWEWKEEPRHFSWLLLAITTVYDCFSFDCCEYHFFQVHYFAQLTNVEVEFCIGEWSTGLFIKKANFDEVDNQPRYEAHYQKLREWHSLNPTVVNNILQKKIFSYAVRSMSITPAYISFTVTQEEFRYCHKQRYICWDVGCCEGSCYEGARRTHWWHGQWNWLKGCHFSCGQILYSDMNLEYWVLCMTRMQWDYRVTEKTEWSL